MRRLSIMLPPGWRWIDLHDDARRDRAIDHVVAGTGLDDGDGARLRRELRDALQRSASDARAAGSSLLALSVDADPVLSGSLTVTFLDGVEELVDQWADDPDEDAVTTTVPAGRVVRRVRREHTTVAEVTCPQGLDTFTVEYLLRCEGEPPVLLVMSSPLVAVADALLGLFDAMMESARWQTV